MLLFLSKNYVLCYYIRYYFSDILNSLLQIYNIQLQTYIHVYF
jgi:hypothetical protein